MISTEYTKDVLSDEKNVRENDEKQRNISKKEVKKDVDIEKRMRYTNVTSERYGS